MRRSICTSESRRASTRVSSGFTLFKHSSPSFGSHRTRSDSNRKRGRSTTHPTSTSEGGSRLVHFHCASCSRRSRGLARTLDSLVRVSRRVRCGPRGWTPSESASGIDRPHSSPQRGVANAFVPAEAGSPFLGRRRGRARRGRSPADAATHRSTSDRADDSGDARVSSDGQRGAAWAWIRTVSRTVELSFQSSFHLSLAVLVRYRSRARIRRALDGVYHPFWAAIPNNPTLGQRPVGRRPSRRARGCHPLRRSLPRDLDATVWKTTAPGRFFGLQVARRGVRFQPWATSRFTRRY